MARSLSLPQDCQFPDKNSDNISRNFKMLFIYLFIPLYHAEPITTLCEGSTERWLRNTAVDQRLDNTRPWMVYFGSVPNYN